MKTEKAIKIGTLVTCANESEVWRVHEINGRFAVVEKTRSNGRDDQFALRRVALNKLHRVK